MKPNTIGVLVLGLLIGVTGTLLVLNGLGMIAPPVSSVNVLSGAAGITGTQELFISINGVSSLPVGKVEGLSFSNPSHPTLGQMSVTLTRKLNPADRALWQWQKGVAEQGSEANDRTITLTLYSFGPTGTSKAISQWTLTNAWPSEYKMDVTKASGALEVITIVADSATFTNQPSNALQVTRSAAPAVVDCLISGETPSQNIDINDYRVDECQSLGVSIPVDGVGSGHFTSGTPVWKRILTIGVANSPNDGMVNLLNACLTGTNPTLSEVYVSLVDRATGHSITWILHDAFAVNPSYTALGTYGLDFWPSEGVTPD